MSSVTEMELSMRRMALWDCLNAWTDCRKMGNDFGMPDCPMALFNVAPGEGIEQKAIARGMRGVFYTDDYLETFLRGITGILNRELWFPGKILSEQILIQNGRGKRSGSLPTLTFREREMLMEIVSRKTNHEIAEKFSVSIHTVKKHLYNIYKKINVSNQFQAAKQASRFL